MTIICDALKKFKRMRESNQKRQQDEVYERKRREIEKKQPEFERDIEKLEEVIEDLKKAQK